MPNCKINEIEVQLIEIIEYSANILSSWKKTIINYNQLNKLLSEITKLLDHIHQCHLHQYMHKSKEFPIEHGTYGGCSMISCLERLIQEMSTEFDNDDNGEIYGRDFILDPNDPNCPLSLKHVQTQFEIRFGRFNDKFKTFFQYFNHFKIKQRCTPVNAIQPLIIQLLLKENPNNPNSQYYDKTDTNLADKSKNNFCINDVYGQTFIINPVDKNKPKQLIEFEKTVSINPDAKKISWAEYLDKCKPVSDPITVDENSVSQCDYVCTRLVGEWLNSTDIDKNGLIYGTDFMFSNTDPYKCRCLREIESDLDWNPPQSIKVISWAEFCHTFKNNNPDDREEI